MELLKRTMSKVGIFWEKHLGQNRDDSFLVFLLKGTINFVAIIYLLFTAFYVGAGITIVVCKALSLVVSFILGIL